MGLWFSLFRRGAIKRYDHIMSLGYNCEIAYQLFKHNRFLESNLFAWTNIPSLDTLIDVLGDLSAIGRDGYLAGNELYRDAATDIGFHGRARPSELANDPAAAAEDVRELTGRVAFLKDKFVNAARDGKTKLYVVKIRGDETDVFEKLNRLRSRLTALTNGDRYDLLVVTEEKLSAILRPTDGDGVYYRAVPFFAPDESVAGKHKNFKAWQRIFDEFRPLRKLRQTKHYKFEDLS